MTKDVWYDPLTGHKPDPASLLGWGKFCWFYPEHITGVALWELNADPEADNAIKGGS